MKTQFVILAAGMGTRLGKSHPKSLTVLDNGETIMARQIRNIKSAFGKNAIINTVVGYKLEEIIDEFPDSNYIYNEEYDATNTSKSLLRALNHIPKDTNVVWMNGDVVFDEDLLFYFKNHLGQVNETSSIVVNSDSVADEEIKYTLDNKGHIVELSKIVDQNAAVGEAVGINFISANDRTVLEKHLKNVDSNDYFEKAIELAIRINHTQFVPFDITKLGISATEVDFEEDLQKANLTLSSK